MLWTNAETATVALIVLEIVEKTMMNPAYFQNIVYIVMKTIPQGHTDALVS